MANHGAGKRSVAETFSRLRVQGKVRDSEPFVLTIYFAATSGVRFAQPLHLLLVLIKLQQGRNCGAVVVEANVGPVRSSPHKTNTSPIVSLQVSTCL